MSIHWKWYSNLFFSVNNFQTFAKRQTPWPSRITTASCCLSFKFLDRPWNSTDLVFPHKKLCVGHRAAVEGWRTVDLIVVGYLLVSWMRMSKLHSSVPAAVSVALMQLLDSSLLHQKLTSSARSRYELCAELVNFIWTPRRRRRQRVFCRGVASNRSEIV